jgi:hypothetical protein
MRTVLACFICALAGCGARTGLAGGDGLDAQPSDSGSDSDSDAANDNICPLTPPTGGTSCTVMTLDASTQPTVMACLYAPQVMGGTAPERYFVCGPEGQWGDVTNLGGAHCSDMPCHPEQAVECIENGTLCCRACDPTGQFVDCGPC